MQIKSIHIPTHPKKLKIRFLMQKNKFNDTYAAGFNGTYAKAMGEKNMY